MVIKKLWNPSATVKPVNLKLRRGVAHWSCAAKLIYLHPQEILHPLKNIIILKYFFNIFLIELLRTTK
jgi:hypothetical protein